MSRRNRKRRMRSSALVADAAERAIHASPLLYEAWAQMSEARREQFWNTVADAATRVMREHGCRAVQAVQKVKP